MYNFHAIFFHYAVFVQFPIWCGLGDWMEIGYYFRPYDFQMNFLYLVECMLIS